MRIGILKWQLAAVTVLGILAGCDMSAPTALQAAESAQVPAQDHYYTVKDGDKYGYEKAISADESFTGQVASEIVMFRYLGERDGVIQLMNTTDRGLHVVFECQRPCDVIKIMSFYKRRPESMRYYRAAESSIGWLASQDAMNGKLEQFYTNGDGIDPGKKLSLWYAETGGPIYTEVGESKAQPN